MEKGAKFFTQKWTLSKTLQISHAVLLRCVKQYSICVFPEICFLFEILRMQKTHFPVASSGDLLLNEKQKKPFVSLNNEVTIIHESLTTASLAQWIRRWTSQIRICFAVTPARYKVGKFFFFRSVPLLLSKIKISISEKNAHRVRETGNRLFAQVIETSIDWASKQVPFAQKRDV